MGPSNFQMGTCTLVSLRNSQPWGQGTLVQSDGEKYEGQFVDGFFEGQGIYYWNDGRKYEGTFQKGQPKGEGNFFSRRQKLSRPGQK